MDVFEILGASILLSPMLLCMAGLIIYVVLDLGRKIFKVQSREHHLEDD